MSADSALQWQLRRRTARRSTGARGSSMTRRLRISLVLGLAMLLTAVATRALTPAMRLAQARERFDLAASIPMQFPGWSVDTGLAPVSPNPDSQAALDKIYDQTLARTYIDASGQRVMLSIAYGGDQSKALQLPPSGSVLRRPRVSDYPERRRHDGHRFRHLAGQAPGGQGRHA